MTSTGFRDWARIVFGPEHGDVLADQYAEAIGRELDHAVFYGTNQENQMNQQQITEVSTTVDTGLSQAEVDGMGEAERLALVVGAAYGAALAERDEARAQADALRALLDDGVNLLAEARPVLDDTTWAADAALARSIQAFLERVDSEQTPTQQETED